MSQEKTVKWKSRRIEAMNRILKRKHHTFHEYFAQEHLNVCESKCKTKAEYKQQWRKNGHN